MWVCMYVYICMCMYVYISTYQIWICNHMHMDLYWIRHIVVARSCKYTVHIQHYSCDPYHISFVIKNCSLIVILIYLLDAAFNVCDIVITWNMSYSYCDLLCILTLFYLFTMCHQNENILAIKVHYSHGFEWYSEKGTVFQQKFNMQEL